MTMPYDTGSFALHVETFMIGMLLAHDAFWIMDTLGDRGMDRLAAYWQRTADRAGWRRS